MNLQTPNFTRDFNWGSSPVFLASAVILGVLFFAGELPSPYLAHDAYPFLHNDSFDPFLYDRRGGHFLQKTLVEGRWLAYLWSHVSPVMTAEIAGDLFLLFLFIICCFVCVQLRVRTTSSALFIFALACGNHFVMNMQDWSPVFTPGLLLVVMFLLIYPKLISARYKSLTLFLFMFIGFQSYPAVSLLILALAFLAPCENRGNPMIDIAAAATAVGLSILLSFSLNWLVHGYFGIMVDSWRHPRPLHSLGDLVANVQNLAIHYARYFLYFLPSLLAFCVGLYLIPRNVRLRSWPAAVPFVFGLLFDVAVSLVEGTRSPLRCFVWLPFAALVPFAWIHDRGHLQLRKYAAQAAMLLVTALILLNMFSHWYELAQVKRAHVTIGQSAISYAHNEGISKAYVSLKADIPGQKLDFVAVVNYVLKFDARVCEWQAHLCSSVDFRSKGLSIQTVQGERVLVIN